VLTLVTALTHAWDVYYFEEEIASGSLSAKLLRPFNPLSYAIVDNFMVKVIRLPPLLLVLGAIAWTFDARVSLSSVGLVLFVPSLLLGAAINFMIMWIMASLMFWVTRLATVTLLYNRAMFIFGGQLAPLTMLPGPLQAIGFALPFAYVLGAPTAILRGDVEPRMALALIGGQMVWLAVSIVAFRLIWRTGLRAYSAVGA
jgi:ABC-2 type transport system permease protein